MVFVFPCMVMFMPLTPPPQGPPAQSLHLDVEAISGIFGSISIACWIVVFSPQIIENFRRSSAEGLSIVFIWVWLIGDFFNIIGAVLQRVLPTMIILAVYYTLADIVLLVQCFYYRGFTLSDEVKKPEEPATTPVSAPNEHTRLIIPQSNGSPDVHITTPSGTQRPASFGEQSHHLSPATPLHPERDLDAIKAQNMVQRTSTLKAILFNGTAILVVCAAGVLGWFLSTGRQTPHHIHRGEKHADQTDSLQFSLWGQIFGYLCALFYLGSRLPQLLLNYRRKSTEGVSMLFFMFACVGNLTYVLSILAFNPICKSRHGCEPGEKGAVYAKNVLVNLSWLIGSFGTLLLDAAVFVQYFIYQKDEDEENSEVAEEGEGRDR